MSRSVSRLSCLALEERAVPAAFLVGDFGEAKLGADGMAFAVEAVR